MLEVENIHTYYGPSYILQGLSLSVGEGTVVSVLGRNGVGKTTLIRSIIGFTPPRRGRILFMGRDITHLSPHKIARLGVGLIPQGRRIFPSLNVGENIEVPHRGKREEGFKFSLQGIWRIFPRLRELVTLKGNELSGGEQQMLCTARALRGNPQLLLMDEPTEGLAPFLVRNLGHLIGQLKQQGLSIILIEQNLPFALEFSDDIYVVNKGAVVYHSPPRDLMLNDEIKSRYLGLG